MPLLAWQAWAYGEGLLGGGACLPIHISVRSSSISIDELIL